MSVDELPKRSVTYKGIFDFGEIYELVHDFLEEKSFTGSEHSGFGPTDMYEVEYLEKGESPRQYQIKWKCKKSIGDFFEARISITFQGKNIAKTEIMHEGVKEKVDNGEITIDVKSEFETNYNKATKEHPFVKHFKGKFEAMMKKEKLSSKKGFKANIEELHELIKHYFKMKGKKLVASVAPVRKG
jgi:hypothetical protein